MDETELKDTQNLYLAFVNLVGKEEDGKYRYEFIFTDNPDEVWGDNWEYKPAGIVNNLQPSDEYKTETHIVKTELKFDLAQKSNCFGMQDCLDGIVALAYENIDGYDEYPDDRGRLVFKFGEKYDDVERKLAQCGILML